MPILNMLTSADLGPLLSPDAADTRDPRRLISMAECIERAQVVYLGLDALSDSMVGGAIGSILVADLAAVAGDRYNYGVNLTPVNVFKGSTTDSRNPLLYTGNVGERLGEEEGDLFPLALLGQLPNLHHLAVLAGGRIVKGRLPILGTPKGAA